jgi:hypothetical protein
MAYTLIKKNSPNLIDFQLMKKIAKINNIDVNTGVSLDKPTEFQLLCEEVKNCTLSCIRRNWLVILTTSIILYCLYRRYHTVKEIKLQQMAEAERHKKAKEEAAKKHEKYINNLRNQYENFDDSNAKKQIAKEQPIKVQSVLAINEMNNGYALW